MKKKILSLLGIINIVTPIIAIVSCNNTGEIDENKNNVSYLTPTEILKKGAFQLNNQKENIGANINRFIYDQSNKTLLVISLLNDNALHLKNAIQWEEQKENIIIDGAITTGISFWNIWNKLKNYFSQNSKLKIIVTIGLYKNLDDFKNFTDSFKKDINLKNFIISNKSYLNFNIDVNSGMTQSEFQNKARSKYKKNDKLLTNIRQEIKTIYLSDSAFYDQFKKIIFK